MKLRDSEISALRRADPSMAESPHPPAWDDDGWPQAFADALRAQRARVQQFLAALGDRERRAQSVIESWLQEQPTCEPSRAAPAGGILDWEAEKQRILAALEAEGDGPSPGLQPAAGSGKELENLVRRTDVLIADRDREISELKRVLEDQSASLGSVAVGAAAVGDILDQDAIIKEERENLRRIQTEWQEKLRAAEIEISVERARLARQRAEVEEKLRAQSAPERFEATEAPAAKADKTPSGRWLARLGLKDPKSA
jgi:hypothetical protein